MASYYELCEKEQLAAKMDDFDENVKFLEDTIDLGKISYEELRQKMAELLRRQIEMEPGKMPVYMFELYLYPTYRLKITDKQRQMLNDVLENGIYDDNVADGERRIGELQQFLYNYTAYDWRRDYTKLL